MGPPPPKAPAAKARSLEVHSRSLSSATADSQPWHSTILRGGRAAAHKGYAPGQPRQLRKQGKKMLPRRYFTFLSRPAPGPTDSTHNNVLERGRRIDTRRMENPDGGAQPYQSSPLIVHASSKRTIIGNRKRRNWTDGMSLVQVDYDDSYTRAGNYLLANSPYSVMIVMLKVLAEILTRRRIGALSMSYHVRLRVGVDPLRTHHIFTRSGTRRSMYNYR
jgi:hypothetical protein